MTGRRGGRVPVPDRITAAGGLAGAEYAWAYELATSRPGRVPAERWARSVFEGSPLLVRGSLIAGWRWGLGLRLGPARSPRHVLGWAIVEAGDDLVILAAGSRLIDAQNVVLAGDSSITWVTFVRARTGFGRALWRVAAPIHQLTLPVFLAHARRSLDRAA